MTDSKQNAEFSISARLKSIVYALEGINYLVRTQHNAWIHGNATLLAVALGIFFEIEVHDWVKLIFAFTLVWAAEAMNTAFEFLCDVACPYENLPVKRAKDIAAGSVLICACGAALIGSLTLVPYVF